MPDASPPLQKDNAFWRFSLAVYSAPGVGTECLALQEALAIDVNLVLFCAWMGAERRAALSEADVARARAVVSDWHDHAVRPLRFVRQFMKPFADPECLALRTRVKGSELEAEQIEQAMLFAHAQTLSPPAGDPALAVLANVAILLRLQQSMAPGAATLPQWLIAESVRRGAESKPQKP